jgi:glutamyl-tRNA reductase
MSKKNKRQSGPQNSCPVNLPEIINMDILSNILDEELRNRERELSQGRDIVSKSGFDPYSWEVELAYVQRERMIRDNWRVNHEKYLRSQPEEYYSDDADTENQAVRELN